MSISKNEIKYIRSLSLKKNRESERCFIVEGEKLVAEAVSSGLKVVKVFRIEDIGEDNMARISQLSSPSPVLAVVEMGPQPDSVPAPVRDRLYLALDGVRDPGNLGTIIRIADWFGIESVFLSEDCVDLYNPKTVQSTMGAIFRVRAYRYPLEEVCRGFLSAGMPVWGTFLEGENIYRADFTPSGLVVMGNEANGISPRIASLVNGKLFIPPYPENVRSSESLNVAVATSVICSEFRRRISCP